MTIVSNPNHCIFSLILEIQMGASLNLGPTFFLLVASMLCPCFSFNYRGFQVCSYEEVSLVIAKFLDYSFN